MNQETKQLDHTWNHELKLKPEQACQSDLFTPSISHHKHTQKTRKKEWKRTCSHWCFTSLCKAFKADPGIKLRHDEKDQMYNV